ncbi:MAG: hypothetical protein KDK34_00530 [Leptospiraceae bacterium]|nr:hypothetical protein [Leptospiraceae bacterium]
MQTGPLPTSDESPEQCSHCVVSVLERPLATQPQLENDRLRELHPDLHGDATAHAPFSTAGDVQRTGQLFAVLNRKLIPPGSLSPPFHLAAVPVYLQNSVFTC